MKKIFCILLIACTGCIEEPVPAEINTVKQIDIELLMGHWLELGQWGRPEYKQVAAVKIDLSLDDKDMIRMIINKIKFTPYGPLSKSRGRATWNPDNSGVFKCALFLNIYRDYYVLYLDPDNTVTLICNKRKTKFWVFSKKPSLSEAQIVGIIQAMQAIGFDPDKFNWHPTYF